MQEDPEDDNYVSAIDSSDYPADYTIVETDEDVDEDNESMIEYLNNQN